MVAPTHCKMCGAKLLFRYHNDYALVCSAVPDTREEFHYVAVIHRQRHVEMDIYGYNGFIIQVVYAYGSDNISHYKLYAPNAVIDPIITFQASQLKFDPHRPDNVINKMKMIMTFS